MKRGGGGMPEVEEPYTIDSRRSHRPYRLSLNLFFALGGSEVDRSGRKGRGLRGGKRREVLCGPL